MSQNHSSGQPGLSKKVPKSIFLGLFFANMAAMMGMGILLPLLSPFAKRLGASETLIGLIFAGFALSRGIFSPLIGRISDRYGRKNIMYLGLGLFCVLSVGYIMVSSLALLAFLWFLQGAASAMVTPIAQSYLGDITPNGKEGRIMNLFYLGQFGGIAIGPVLGGYLSETFSFNAPFYVMIVVSLFALGLIYFSIPARRVATQGNEEDNESVDFKKSFMDVLKDGSMRGVFYYMVGRGFYRWGFNALFPIYALTMTSLSTGQVGLIITTYMITGALSQYPFGRLADIFTQRKAELVAVGGGIAALTTFFVPFLSQLGWLIVLMVAMGIFSAMSRASTVVIRTKRGRVHGMGAVTGFYTASFSSGQVIGPFIFGAIADIWGIPISFYVGAIVGILTTAAAFRLLKRIRTERKAGRISETGQNKEAKQIREPTE